VGASPPVPAGSPGKLLLFHCGTGGSWTVEDVSASTGITYGGFIDTTPDESTIAGRLLVLDANGYLWQLQRNTASAPSSWTATNISAAIGEQFVVKPDEQTVSGLPAHPGAPASEAHFVAIGPDSHLVEFWVGAQGVWRKEDLSDTTSQPVFQHFARPSASSGSSSQYRQTIMGLSPSGHFVMIWGDPGDRDWKAFDASAALGPALLTGWRLSTWVGNSGNDYHLVGIEKD
jgi:hypothetical protein